MENNLTKFNVIIDTNVIISSLLTSHKNSVTAQVMDLFYNDKINVYYSDEIYKEYLDVLSRKKFDFEKCQINFVLGFINENAIKINPKHLEELLIDIKNKPFYEIVMDKKIDNAKLVTGNIKHFPASSKIITAKEFIDLFNKGLK